MEPQSILRTFIAGILSSCLLDAAPISDDFTGGLESWTSTVILDVNGGASNGSAFQVNGSDQLELDTTTYDDIEQIAYIRSGATLAVGEEAQLTMALPVTASRNFGLYVGGTAPVTGTREDYISVYGHETTELVRTRGFDGAGEYNNLGGTGAGVTTLFIARIDTNEFEVGYYDSSGKTVITTRTPVTPNLADQVGIYADVRAVGTLGAIDSFQIVDIPIVYEATIDETTWSSGEAVGSVIGFLLATVNGDFEDTTFALVAGEGDDDNELFKIGGTFSDELQVNADFTAAGEAPVDGQQYFVRVQGTDVATGTLMTDSEIVLTVFKDDDLDTLGDDWELFWQENLTDLFLGNDKDGDGLNDEDEFDLFEGTFTGGVSYDVDPDNADTDGDMLSDGEETVNLVGARPITDPTIADSDSDGLTDFEETNSGGAETPPMVGTSGINLDSDGDGAKDGHEVASGSDPLDDGSSPPSASSSVTVTQITDDASTGISTSKTYTHAVSGGYATTVNGVNFEVLDLATTPANFDWIAASGKQVETPANLGNWLPGTGGVTGSEIIDLLSGFTYSAGQAPPAGAQTYTLSGLTPGAEYELRIYTRAWAPLSDSGRLIDLTFTNGTEVVLPWCSLAMDRPGFVLGSLNHDEAYFISYSYTAQGTELVIDAPMPLGADNGISGFDTMHLYGLTNELTGTSDASMAVTDIFFDGGDLKITFSPGGAGFILTSSDDLVTPFVEETNALYDGVDTFTVPASSLSPGSDYFRVEKP